MNSLPQFSPMANRWVAGIATAVVADSSECEGFLLAVAEMSTRRPSTTDTARADDLGHLIPGAEDGRLLEAVMKANNDYFRYDISYLIHEGEPEIETLALDPDGTPLPSRLTSESSTRKLTCLLLAEVADLEAAIRVEDSDGRKAVDIAVGTLTVFPSFLGVNLLADRPTRGSVIVFSAYGPAFR